MKGAPDLDRPADGHRALPRAFVGGCRCCARARGRLIGCACARSSRPFSYGPVPCRHTFDGADRSRPARTPAVQAAEVAGDPALVSDCCNRSAGGVPVAGSGALHRQEQWSRTRASPGSEARRDRRRGAVAAVVAAGRLFSSRPVSASNAGLYTGLTEDLASHGYVVVAIDHPHDAAIVQFPDGHVVIPASQMDIQRAHTVRVADTRFVLTELARLARSGVFAGRLDLGRIGMFGHSLGGAAAASTMLVDRRIRAGADLDGLLFGQVRTSGLSRPFLLMNAEPGFAAEPNRAGFWKKLRGPHYAVDVKRAQHFAFSDLVFLVPALMRTNPTAGASRETAGRGCRRARDTRSRARLHQRLLRPIPAREATTTAREDPRPLRRHAPNRRTVRHGPDLAHALVAPAPASK